jgi:CRISPR system Cascade subunit CasE
MYLSRIRFTPDRRLEMVRQLRKGLYSEHQMIWSLMPGDVEAKRDFLYHREDSAQKPFYLLLSARQPVVGHVFLDVETKTFDPKIETGEHLYFSLRANAVVTRKVDETSNRRIRRDIVEAKLDAIKAEYPEPQDRPPNALIREEAGQNWLQKQGERNGFRPSGIMVENHQFHHVTKPGDANKRHFSSLDFHGWLEVTDVAAFRKVLFLGLGRSKAFGCGLLLVRRV